MQKEQYLAIGLSLAVLFSLYFLGNTKSDKTVAETVVDVRDAFAEYERLKISELPIADADKIKELNRLSIIQQDFSTSQSLSKAWEDIGNYPLGAYYYYKASELVSDTADWELAGDKLYNSYKNYADTLITDNLLTFALTSYENVDASKKDELPFQMKLADVYVESPEPMKGILMMRNIVENNPDYIPAIMRLGRLSLQTGQYDKALSRFNQVLEENSVNTEALYFLALANEGLGNIDEAIRLLETCKQLVGIPEFSIEVDDYIKNLKK